MTASVATMGTGERILAAAAQMTAEIGWSGVTMAAVAERVGVSRQTVYNEWGTRDRLAEAMVLRELSSFLGEVDAGFADYPHDLEAGVAAAIGRVLDLAAINPLLRAIVTATHGAGTELVPLLTTRADAVIGVARERVRDRLLEYPDVDRAAVDVISDILVRTVLSHVMQPDQDQRRLPADLGAATATLLVSLR
jgi:AcrR family transcriptional regulator